MRGTSSNQHVVKIVKIRQNLMSEAWTQTWNRGRVGPAAHLGADNLLQDTNPKHPKHPTPNLHL